MSRKKSCQLFEKEYQHPLFLQSLTKLSEHLSSKFGDNGVNEQQLANTIYQLQLFMEFAYGRGGKEQNIRMVKLPARLFKNFDIDGPLCTALTIAMTAQSSNKWKNFSLTSAGRYDEGIAILKAIETAVIQSGHWTPPKIYFNKLAKGLVNELAAIAQKQGATIVSDISTATHIVEWDDEIDNLPEELTEDFVRTLELRPYAGKSGSALVHWLYYPDSCNEWISGDEVDGTDVPEDDNATIARGKEKQWRVACRFVRDCALFNEWGAELDYEIAADDSGATSAAQEGDSSPRDDSSMQLGGDDDADDAKGGSAGGKKSAKNKKGKGRKRNTAHSGTDASGAAAVSTGAVDSSVSSDSNSAAARKQDNVLPEGLIASEAIMQAVPPPSLDPYRQSLTTLEFPNAAGQTYQITQDDRPSAKRKAGGDVDRSNMQTRSSSTTSLATSSINNNVIINNSNNNNNNNRLPDWFDFDSINAIEMKYLSQIIGKVHKDQLSLQSYITMRNFIITMYSQNPTLYLSGTDCRRKLAGDVSVVIRIHEFLDAFGLINYSVKSDCRPHGLPLMAAVPVSTACSSSTPVLLSQDDEQLATLTAMQIASTRWNQARDNKLMDSVLKYQGDWDKIACELNSGSPDHTAVSPSQCLARFISLPLSASSSSNSSLSSSTTANSHNQSFEHFGSHLTVQHQHRGDVMRTAVPMCIQLFAGHASSCGLLQEDSFRKIVQQSIMGVQQVNGCAEAKIKKEVVSLSACASALSGALNSQLKQEDAQLQSALQDYVELRLTMLEDKAKLLSEISAVLDLDRQRLEVERRDVQFQRAQLAVQQSSSATLPRPS